MQSWRLKDDDDDNRWENVIPLIGVFHFFMSAFKQANKSHQETISWLVGTFIGKNDKEATEKNISYFLNFSDPTKYERMMGSIIHAIFDHAVRSLKKSTHCIEASPLVVFEYMKSVAKKVQLQWTY